MDKDSLKYTCVQIINLREIDMDFVITKVKSS